MLANGAEGLRNMRQEAHDLGIVFDQEAANNAAAFNDAMTKIKGAAAGVGAVIATNLAPILTDFMAKLTEVVKNIIAWAEVHPKLAQAIILVVVAIGGLMAVLGPLLIMLPMLAAGFTMVWTAATGGLILLIAAIIAAVVLIIMNWDKIVGFFQNLWANVVNIFQTVWANIVGFIQAHWDQILAILFPAVGLPILIARNWEAIVDTIKDIFDRVKQLVADAINWIIDKINKLPAINIPAVSIGGMSAAAAVPVMDTGGLVRGPGLFAVGAGVREIVREPSGSGSGVTITGNNFYIREEADVTRVARELERMRQSRERTR
jgi:hypothetical protein